MTWKNKLYFGDNLDMLQEDVPDDSVDLIYLDPPFNSDADYNVLFKERSGKKSTAQIAAFEDTWHWGLEAEKAFNDLVTKGPSRLADIVQSLRNALGPNDMMAYLVMMAARLRELRRVLKPTGTLYLHCDLTASHYLKVILDAIFGPTQFLNEITWKRTQSHGNVNRNFGSICDLLLVYTKSDEYTWNQQYTQFSKEYVEHRFTGVDPDGRRWQSVTLRNPGVRPNLHYPYKASNGVTYHPHPNGWSCDPERMKKYDKENRLHFPAKPDGKLRLKMYLDESPGVKLQNLWDDIPPVNSQAAERLDYPTQKPEDLLARIIATSSNEGDVVLDPFCGCGTTLVVAERLKRKWIGIDITHLAVALMRWRLRHTFKNHLAAFDELGSPKDTASAARLAELDRYQFQYWAVGLVDGQPAQEKKKGADKGIDGYIYFRDDTTGQYKKIIIQVKSGGVQAKDVRDLRGVIGREKADFGFFLTLEEPTKPMRTEAVDAGLYESETFKRKYQRIQIITVAELLEGKRPDYPQLDPAATLKQAPVTAKATHQKDLF